MKLFDPHSILRMQGLLYIVKCNHEEIMLIQADLGCGSSSAAWFRL